MLLDAHTHIDMYRDEQLPTILAEIARHQIFTLSVSIDVPAYQRAQQIAAQAPHIVPLFGIHPWEAHRYADKLPSLLPFMAKTPLFGEIGLDFHFFKEPTHQAQQRAVLDFFLDAAVAQQKIVNLHVLGAEKEVLTLLETFRPPTPIVHWYSGPRSLIDRYLAVGTYFSFGVEMLFSQRIERLLTAVPPQRLLTETDNPTAYSHFAHQPGTPNLLPQIVAKIAQVRQMTETEVVDLVADNFTRLIAPVASVAKKWKETQKTWHRG
ncbi:MAG: TatD family hydrolase [Anaerolineales bacterium]|nr:TatD family hydrolase [Anaerolineales bacterium]